MKSLIDYINKIDLRGSSIQTYLLRGNVREEKELPRYAVNRLGFNELSDCDPGSDCDCYQGDCDCISNDCDNC